MPQTTTIILSLHPLVFSFPEIDKGYQNRVFLLRAVYFESAGTVFPFLRIFSFLCIIHSLPFTFLFGLCFFLGLCLSDTETCSADTTQQDATCFIMQVHLWKALTDWFSSSPLLLSSSSEQLSPSSPFACGVALLSDAGPQVSTRNSFLVLVL